MNKPVNASSMIDGMYQSRAMLNRVVPGMGDALMGGYFAQVKGGVGPRGNGKVTRGGPCPVCGSETAAEEVSDGSLVGGRGWKVECTNVDCDHYHEIVPPEVGEAERGN